MATTVNVKDVLRSLAPFFDSNVRFVSKTTDYSCAFCALTVVVVATDNEIDEDGKLKAPIPCALSYNVGRGTWAHLDCLVKAGGTVVTDSKVKAKARKLAQDRLKNARTASRTTPVQPTTPAAPILTVDLPAVRAQIEAEYDAVMTSAIETINALTEQVKLLQAQLETATTPKSVKKGRKAA